MVWHTNAMFHFLPTNFRINLCPVCQRRILPHTTRQLNFTEEDMSSTSNDSNANSEQASSTNVHANDDLSAGVASKSPNEPTMCSNANRTQRSGILTEQNLNIDQPNRPTSDRAAVSQIRDGAKMSAPKKSRPIPDLLFVGKTTSAGTNQGRLFD